MGVPGLYGIVIRRYFSTILLNKLPIDVQISNLLLDLNAMFHDAKAKVLLYGEFRKQLERRGEEGQRKIEAIDERNATISDEELEKLIFDQIATNILDIVKEVKPSQRLVMAVDGLAPVAKLNQQRGRRKKSAMNRADPKTELSPGEERFDASSSFTPGTDVMFRLDAYLLNFIQTRKYQLASKIVYYNHLTRGEGEHKLISYLREEIPADENAVLVGADADLIMLALRVHQHTYIVRKNLNPETRWNPETRKREPEPKVMDIKLLKNALDIANVEVDDFIFVMFLYGNDFIPPQPGFDLGKSFADIWARLQTHKLFLNGELQYSNWRDFLTTLTATQYRLIGDLAKEALDYPFELAKKSMVNDELDEDTFRGWWITRMFFAETVPYTDEELSDAVQWSADEYLKTLLWINQYYKDHLSPNWNYAYPRLFTPLIQDAMIFNEDVQAPKVEAYKLNPLGQLMAVMPLEIKNTLPEAIQVAYDFNSPIADMYPAKIGELIEGKAKNMKHVSTLWLPPIDISRVIDVQNRLRITKEKLARYAPASVFEVVRTSTGVEAPPILPRMPKANPLPQMKQKATGYAFNSEENIKELSKLYGYDVVSSVFSSKHRFYPESNIISPAVMNNPQEGRELIEFPTVEVIKRELK